MKLRPQLMPAKIDKSLIPPLLDDLSTVEENSAPEDEVNAAIARLQAISDEDITPAFAAVILTNYDAQWVRAALYKSQIRPVDNVTRDELLEVLRRGEPGFGRDEARRQAYREIFDVNVPLPSAWYLMFYPPEPHDESISGYNPTREQIVDWIFDPHDISLLSGLPRPP